MENFTFNKRPIKFNRFDDRGIGIVRIDGVRNKQVDDKSVSSQHIEIQVISKPDCTISKVNPLLRIVDLELPKEELENLLRRRSNGRDKKIVDASEQHGELFLAIQRKSLVQTSALPQCLKLFARSKQNQRRRERKFKN